MKINCAAVCIRPAEPIRVFTFLIVLLGVVACQTGEQSSTQGARSLAQEQSGSSTGDELRGATWQLMALGEEPVVLEQEQRRPWIEFAAEENRVGGFAGCNQFGGSYHLDGHGIEFGPLAATKMFCTGIMEIEQGLMAALSQARRWRIEDGRLALLDAEGEMLARFEAKAVQRDEKKDSGA